MSMSPAALEAYARDYLRARRDEAEHAALVALVRHPRPPSTPAISPAWLPARLAAALDRGLPKFALVRWLTAGRPALALLRLPRK